MKIDEIMCALEGASSHALPGRRTASAETVLKFPDGSFANIWIANKRAKQMKKLLLAAAFACIAGAASAKEQPTIPEIFRGEWCGAYNPKGETWFSKKTEDEYKDGCLRGMQMLTITANSYSFAYFDCDVVNIKTWIDKSKPASTHSMGATVSRIDGKCNGEDWYYHRKIQIYHYKSHNLFYKARGQGDGCGEDDRKGRGLGLCRECR